jgi:hypothetical protein
MTLDLTDAETQLLAEILDNEFRDLKDEIHRTETYEYKEALKQREALMVNVLTKLGRPLTV